MMKNLLWWFYDLVTNNRGYVTPKQKRFEVGDVVRISTFCLNNKLKPGEMVVVIENSRYDYLVESFNGEKYIVFQFELD